MLVLKPPPIERGGGGGGKFQTPRRIIPFSLVNFNGQSRPFHFNSVLSPHKIKWKIKLNWDWEIWGKFGS